MDASSHTITPVETAFREYRQQAARLGNCHDVRGIWLWNMNVSMGWGGKRGHVLSRMGQYMSSPSERWPELSLLNVLLADEGDSVLCEAETFPGELTTFWRELGLSCPDFTPIHVPATCADARMAVREAVCGVSQEPRRRGRLDMLICFGNDAWTEELASKRGLALFGGDARSSLLCNNKVVVRRWCRQLGLLLPEGRACRSSGEILDTAAVLLKRFDRVVVKEPYGISGKGMVVVSDAARLGRLCRAMDVMSRSDRTPELLVEGWYDKCATHNAQYMILPDGRIRFLGASEQILRGQRYEGNYFHPAGGPDRLWAGVAAAQSRIVERASAAGYRGVIGLDSFHTDREAFPVIEANARMNMSTFVRAMIDRIEHSGAACAMTYTFRWQDRMSLDHFLRHVGFAHFFDPAKGRGIVPVAYAGSLERATRGVTKTMLLFLGEDRCEVEELRRAAEPRLRALGAADRATTACPER